MSKPATNAPASESDLQLPRVFGRLILLKRMARGGMGEVYLAATRGIEGAERPCVVKTIRAEHVGDKSFRARFLDETRVQAQLQHPGVAQILEANEAEDGSPYAVVEYIEGRHLGEVLGRGHSLGTKMGWAEAVALGVSFGEALAHVHERCDANGQPLEISHRDLSPQNLMLSYAGDVKLIDFGTARGENRRCRTVSGVVYAKPGYVAPEVANQIPGGPQADLYAFGVILWEALAGRRFLQGDSVAHQALVAQGKKPLPKLAEEVGAPAEVDTILARLTETSLLARYSTAREAMSDLLNILKKAPSLANGERGVRARLQHYMQVLYPAEPARSRVDFGRRVAAARRSLSGAPKLEVSNLRPDIPEPSPHAPEVQIEGLLPGTRYRLEREVSISSMGEVHEALHVDLGRRVAIKFLPQSIAKSAAARLRFRAEARVLARLEHPGLVRIFDYGVSADSRCFYVMEWLEGQTLQEKLEAGPLSPEVVSPFLLQAARALSVAHRAGIVHRDITPSNLFITREGELKLLDFGVCLSEAPSENNHTPEVVGTPEYISPEQAAGAGPDGRSDLYSLGAVFYECLTGKVPHPLGEGGSPNLAALLTAKITQAPALPSSIVPEAARFDALLLKLLSRDADQRYQDASEVVAAVDAAQGDSLSTEPSSWLRAAFQRGTLRKAKSEAEPTKQKAAWPRKERAYLMGAAVALMLTLAGVNAALSSAEANAPSAMNSASDDLDAEALAAGADEQELDLDQLGKLVSAELAEQAASEDAASDQALAQKLENEKSAVDASAHALAAAEIPSVHQEEIDANLSLLKRQMRIKAHHQMKELAKKAPSDALVQAGLIRTAGAVSAWGEALDAAQELCALRGNAADLVELAKLEHATLRGDASATLQKALLLDPSLAEARALLERYSDDRVASVD